MQAKILNWVPHVVEWENSKDEEIRRLGDAAYVIPPKASDSEPASDSESEENVPLAKLAKRYRQETESSEDDIPLMELRKRLKHRERRQNKNEETEVKEMECDEELSSDESHFFAFSSI